MKPSPKPDNRIKDDVEAENERLNALIERLMSIAHASALFNGGSGNWDPMVGFATIMSDWDDIVTENEQLENEVERLEYQITGLQLELDELEKELRESNE